MKQVIQYVNTGKMDLAEVPVPSTPRQGVLVRTQASLVSAGTERMVVDFAEKNLIAKARSRPDLVQQTLDKAQREGLLTTLDAVVNRMSQPMSLGYSSAGTVMDVGAEVTQFKVGDRVACAGSGHAVHAELAAVTTTLTVPLPDNVSFEAAAFTTLGAIALHGIRLSEAKLGEVVAVIGLGLLGQLAVQMLKMAGCVVLGMDIQPTRAELARELGADAVASTAEELEAASLKLSAGYGLDAVLITADTKSNEPVMEAGKIARDKGIVVAVGAVGMEIPRKVYYEKELDFRISRSYGPGRYDQNYEEQGHDYPYGYVRWTEQRNMQAFVHLLSTGAINVEALITHRFSIEDAAQAYEVITGKTGEPFMGVVLTYPNQPDMSRKVRLSAQESIGTDGSGTATNVNKVKLGVLGSGNYANATLLPALKDLSQVQRVGIASSGGLSARTSGQRFGFTFCTTDNAEILQNPDINTVAILTRHNLHAKQVIAALQAGKHVFVEKPLCLTESELNDIIAAYNAADDGKRTPALMVGYNRRFAPFVVELKRQLRSISEPLVMNYRVNAGIIPASHWTQDPSVGGGRLLGEGCHFIDLLMHVAGAKPVRVTTLALPDYGQYVQDNLLITIEFVNGSIGTVTYIANGNKSFGKEMLEVFGGGLSARIDDYRLLEIRRGPKRIREAARLRQDKGHKDEWAAFAAHLTGSGPAPIPFQQLVLSTRATLAAKRSLETGLPVEIA